MLKVDFMRIFPRPPVWNIIRESAKRPTSLDHISTNILRKYLSFGAEVQNDCGINGFFLAYETLQKKIMAQMPRWSVWSSKTLESKALIPNFMKPTHKIEEKIYQHLQNKPPRGGNLLYITQMNNSWMIQMTNPPFYL